MILENLKQYVFLIIRNNIIDMYKENDEQNHLARYIKEFKTKAKPQSNSSFKKVKEDVINSAMVILKGREMVFKAFESGMFSRLNESDQSEESEQPSDDVKYNSFVYDTYKLSKKVKDVSLEDISSDLNDTDNTDNKLFTTIKTGTGLTILTPKQMLQRLPIALHK